MKSKIALAAGISVIAAAPAYAAGSKAVFATWDECIMSAEAAGSGNFKTFTYVCVPTPDGGWEIVWSKRERQQRGGGKPTRNRDA